MFGAAVKAADILLAGKDLVSLFSFFKHLRKEGPKVDKADCSSLWTSSSSVEQQLTWYFIAWYLLQTMLAVGMLYTEAPLQHLHEDD